MASDDGYDYLNNLATQALNCSAAYETVRDAFVRFTDAQLAEIIPLHREMADRFEKWLMREKYLDVRKEQGWVDVRFRTSSRRFMAELKICYGLNTRQAIREALGQVLEYNHYPERMPHDEWWVVLDQTPADADNAYVRRIRDLYRLPVYLGYETSSGSGEFAINK